MPLGDHDPACVRHAFIASRQVVRACLGIHSEPSELGTGFRSVVNCGITDSFGIGESIPTARPSLFFPSTASPLVSQTSPLRRPSTAVIVVLMLRLYSWDHLFEGSSEGAELTLGFSPRTSNNPVGMGRWEPQMTLMAKRGEESVTDNTKRMYKAVEGVVC